MNQRNESDEVLAKAIIAKLEKTPGIPFAECARNARALGRVRLAVELLERETSAQLQVGTRNFKLLQIEILILLVKHYNPTENQEGKRETESMHEWTKRTKTDSQSINQP